MLAVHFELKLLVLLLCAATAAMSLFSGAVLLACFSGVNQVILHLQKRNCDAAGYMV